MSTDDETWLLGVAEGLVVEDAPVGVVERAVASFRARVGAGTPTAPSWVDRLRTAITFDSWLGSPTPAMRGGVAEDARHLVYGADGDAHEVAISVYPAGDATVTVVGHVMARATDARFLVEAVTAADVVLASTTTSVAGEFTLMVPAGWTELVVTGADIELSLPAAPDDPAR